MILRLSSNLRSGNFHLYFQAYCYHAWEDVTFVDDDDDDDNNSEEYLRLQKLRHKMFIT